MTELEKYEKVNKCETLEELADVIISFSNSEGMIEGKTRSFSASLMAENCIHFSKRNFNTLTRQYNIRQQAMYILYYTGKFSGI